MPMRPCDEFIVVLKDQGTTYFKYSNGENNPHKYERGEATLTGNVIDLVLYDDDQQVELKAGIHFDTSSQIVYIDQVSGKKRGLLMSDDRIIDLASLEKDTIARCEGNIWGTYSTKLDTCRVLENMFRVERGFKFAPGSKGWTVGFRLAW